MWLFLNTAIFSMKTKYCTNFNFNFKVGQYFRKQVRVFFGLFFLLSVASFLRKCPNPRPLLKVYRFCLPSTDLRSDNVISIFQLWACKSLRDFSQIQDWTKNVYFTWKLQSFEEKLINLGDKTWTFLSKRFFQMKLILFFFLEKKEPAILFEYFEKYLKWKLKKNKQLE